MNEKLEFYTIDEVAAYLRLSRETVRRWIINKKIPSLKFGIQYRIAADTFEKIKNGHFVL